MQTTLTRPTRSKGVGTADRPDPRSQQTSSLPCTAAASWPRLGLRASEVMRRGAAGAARTACRAGGGLIATSRGGRQAAGRRADRQAGSRRAGSRQAGTHADPAKEPCTERLGRRSHRAGRPAPHNPHPAPPHRASQRRAGAGAPLLESALWIHQLSASSLLMPRCRQAGGAGGQGSRQARRPCRQRGEAFSCPAAWPPKLQVAAAFHHSLGGWWSTLAPLCACHRQQQAWPMAPKVWERALRT